jgi:hypothetical protein
VRHDAGVRESEILRDDTAPAVGTEFNRRHQGVSISEPEAGETAGLAC